MENSKISIDDVEAMDCETITMTTVGQVLGCNQGALRLQARSDPAMLGFPVVVYGNSVRVPRRAFVHWVRYGNAPVYTRRDPA